MLVDPLGSIRPGKSQRAATQLPAEVGVMVVLERAMDCRGLAKRGLAIVSGGEIEKNLPGDREPAAAGTQ